MEPLLKKVLFAGAIVGVLALMGYGVYEAFESSDAETRAGEEGGRFGVQAAVDGSGSAIGQGQGRGGGRWATEERPEAGTEAILQGGGQGQGFGRAAAAQAPGQAGGQGAGSGTGTYGPDAEDLAWTEVAGSVVSIDGSEPVVLTTAKGKSVTAGLGKPSYWESLGIQLQAGDEIRLTGFWEDGEFEVQSLTQVATAQRVVLRDQSGRPLWAGGGR